MASASWRAYHDSVSDSAYAPNLDTDLAYIVALGVLGKLAPPLKAASERGYSPAWFRPDEGQHSKGQHSKGQHSKGQPAWASRHGPAGMGDRLLSLLASVPQQRDAFIQRKRQQWLLWRRVEAAARLADSSCARRQDATGCLADLTSD
jgi:hypothetical protein